jgi:uncharacterized membrane protein
MKTDRGLDRLTYFTDAIAAIAITLLILPIVDRVAESADGGQSVGDFLGSNIGSLIAFALSFVLIARFWVSHHTIFIHVAAYSNLLRWLSLGWAFTVVLLPLPSSMLAGWKTVPLLVGFYIGTLLANSALLTTMIVLVYRDPTISDPANPVPIERVWGSVATTSGFLVAFVLGTFVPSINYWGLLVLLISGPISAVVRQFWERRHA